MSRIGCILESPKVIVVRRKGSISLRIGQCTRCRSPSYIGHCYTVGVQPGSTEVQRLARAVGPNAFGSGPAAAGDRQRAAVRLATLFERTDFMADASAARTRAVFEFKSATLPLIARDPQDGRPRRAGRGARRAAGRLARFLRAGAGGDRPVAAAGRRRRRRRSTSRRCARCWRATRRSRSRCAAAATRRTRRRAPPACRSPRCRSTPAPARPAAPAPSAPAGRADRARGAGAAPAARW